MNLLRLAAGIAVVTVAVAAGGAVVRIGVFGRLWALAALAVVAAAVLLAFVVAAKSRRWLENPYW